ncbi:MAG: DedA family protein [Gammaproteobacteria bacterium]
MLDPHTLPQYVSEYGYLAIFLLSLVEGPIVTLYAAVLAAQGIFNLFLVYLMVVLGDLTGDVLVYSLGRFGIGHPAWHRRLLSRAMMHRIAQLRRKLHARAGHVLLFGKLTQAFGFAILIAAGAARIRLGVFLFYNLLGTLLKSAALLAIGYCFGRFYSLLGPLLQDLGVIGFGVGILLTVYLVHRLSATHSNQPHEEPPCG